VIRGPAQTAGVLTFLASSSALGLRTNEEIKHQHPVPRCISRYCIHGDRSMPKIALITGITGQDGSYLAELLLEQRL
jgi:hypothetical protein